MNGAVSAGAAGRDRREPATSSHRSREGTLMKSTVSARRATVALALVGSSLAIPPLVRAAAGRQPAPSPDLVVPRIPESVRLEHEAIQRELALATREPGQVGAAARDLAKVLRPHFEREGFPAHPEDPYTVESVRAALSDLLRKLPTTRVRPDPVRRPSP